MSKGFPSKQERVLVDLTTDKEIYLVGWPGYRNARGRSGLGYVETQAEWAQMKGRLFRMMVTGQTITRNPIFLFGMFIVGLIYLLPLILSLLEMIGGNSTEYILFLVFSPVWLFGLLIFRSVFIAVFGRSLEEEEQRESEE